MLWSKLKTLMIVTSLLGLGSLNILTLVDDGVHAVGYNAIKVILASAITDEALSKMLGKSPTAKRQADIKTATKVISDEKAMLVKTNKTLEKKHAALEKSHKEMVSEHAELKRTSGKQAATALKVSKRLAIRSLSNATRNVSSVAGEAIPFAGVAIIVGVTAWDVYDACETLKDSNELNNAFGQEQEDQTKVCGMKVPTKEQVLAKIKGNWKAAYQSTGDSLNKVGVPKAPVTPP